MTNYQKGARFERDVVNEFWSHGWAALRAAGSGSVGQPVPDVIGVREGKIIAVECKTTRREKAYLEEAVLKLKRFMEISNAEAYLAVKFPKKKPMFFNIKKLLREKKYNVTANDKHLSLESILGEQRTL
ncbi:MAG: hypothetical protein JW778_08125 [Candidatus Altiarchaeota archaeon]|nr:hypothetical protein [Candidatus Altiarchaeota archaeon]